MAKVKDSKLQRHKILREAYRHIEEFKELTTHSSPDPATGRYGQGGRVINAQFGGLKDVIEYKGITLSYFDLKEALKNAKLAPRKREAFYYNVLLDMRQRDVAEIMGITTVSVGQYVEQAMLQIAKEYFKDEDSPNLKGEDT